MKRKMLLLMLLLSSAFMYTEAQTTIQIMGKKAYISGTPKDIRIWCPPPYDKACIRLRTGFVESDDPIGSNVKVDIFEDDRIVKVLEGRLEQMQNTNSKEGNFITLFLEEYED